MRLDRREKKTGSGACFGSMAKVPSIPGKPYGAHTCAQRHRRPRLHCIVLHAGAPSTSSTSRESVMPSTMTRCLAHGAPWAPTPRRAAPRCTAPCTAPHLERVGDALGHGHVALAHEQDPVVDELRAEARREGAGVAHEGRGQQHVARQHLVAAPQLLHRQGPALALRGQRVDEPARGQEGSGSGLGGGEGGCGGEGRAWGWRRRSCC